MKSKTKYKFYWNSNKTHPCAVNALILKSGNYVDQSHLLIALFRASNLPTRYVNGKVTFTVSCQLGHGWAEVYIDGKWVTADITNASSRLGYFNWKNPIISGCYAEITF